MTVERNIARAPLAEADSSAAGVASQQSPTLEPTLEWPTVDLQEVLETLGPEERELLILATTGC